MNPEVFFWRVPRGSGFWGGRNGSDRARTQRRRGLALDAVGRSFPPGTELDAPWGGYMLWVRLPQGVDMGALKTRAHAAGVVFATGAVFHACPAGENRPAPQIRINCAKAAEPDLERGVEILGKIVSELA